MEVHVNQTIDRNTHSQCASIRALISEQEDVRKLVEELANRLDRSQEASSTAQNEVSTNVLLEIGDLKSKVLRLTEQSTKLEGDLSFLAKMSEQVELLEDQILKWRYRLPELTDDDSQERIVSAVEVREELDEFKEVDVVCPDPIVAWRWSRHCPLPWSLDSALWRMTSKSSSSRWSVFHARLIFNFFTSFLVRDIVIPILNADPSIEIIHHLPMIVNSSITCPNRFTYCTSILTTQHRFQSENLRHELTKSVYRCTFLNFIEPCNDSSMVFSNALCIPEICNLS